MAKSFISVILMFSLSLSNAAQTTSPKTSVLKLDSKTKQETIKRLFVELEMPPVSRFDRDSLLQMRTDMHKWETTPVALAKQPSQPQLDELVKQIYPHFAERVLRSSTQKVELIQQPRTILLQGATTLTPVPNPDSVLVRYTGTTTYAELFPSITDVSGQAMAFKDAGLDIGISRKTICKYEDKRSNEQSKLLDCLMRIGTANRFGRLISGLKGTFNYGQNPQIQLNILVNGTPGSSKNFSLSGQVDFDPKGLVLTGSDWNTAYQSAKVYGPLVERAMRTRIRRRCGIFSDLPPDGRDMAIALNSTCLAKLSKPSGSEILGIFLTPQVSEVVRNQFDFIKQNGTLVAAPYPTNSLQDVTFTLDLTRIFPSAKSRTDALSVLANFNKAIEPAKNNLRAAVGAKFQELAWQPEYLDDDDWYHGFFEALLAACATVPTCAAQE